MSDPIVAKDSCETTIGDDNKTLTGPAAGFQTDGQRDFKCHRIAGSVKKDGNVRVGLLDDQDPTAGYYFTVAGGDDCSEGRDDTAYQSRSLTIVVRCNLESEAIGKVPEIEEVVEG